MSGRRDVMLDGLVVGLHACWSIFERFQAILGAMKQVPAGGDGEDGIGGRIFTGSW